MFPFDLKITIFSHLSDVQESLSMPSERENNRMRINFVKMLISKLESGTKEMTEDELNDLWVECNKKFGGK